MKQELETEEMLLNEPFSEVKRQMEGDPFWIRMFIRPCCKRPNEREAHMKMAGLRSVLSERTDFSNDQQSELLAIVKDRENWYISRFC